MALREAKGPYMIYNGPIPEAVKARLAQTAVERAEAAPLGDPDEEATTTLALILLLMGTLAVGLALGLWLRPTVDRAFGHAALSSAPVAVASVNPLGSPPPSSQTMISTFGPTCCTLSVTIPDAPGANAYFMLLVTASHTISASGTARSIPILSPAVRSSSSSRTCASPTPTTCRWGSPLRP